MPRDGASRTVPTGEKPAALLEDPIGARVELARGLIDRQLAVHRAFRDQAQLVGDALPFGHLGRGLHALELLAEGASVEIFGQPPLGPGRASWREVSGQLVEAPLDVGPREILYPLPRRSLDARGAEDDEAR